MDGEVEGIGRETKSIATHLTLAFLHIYLVTQDDKGEVLGIVWAGLDKEFIAPTVQSLERFSTVHVIHENTAIRASIEGDTKRLEAFLTSSIPELSKLRCSEKEDRLQEVQGNGHLHGDKSIIDHDLLRQAGAIELLVNIVGYSGVATYKSAPIVALYWLLNRLLTYWFMREVFPTLS